MLLDEQYNTLFHRCVDRNNQPRTMKEVYEYPLPVPHYSNSSYENPLYGYMKLNTVDIVTFGTYNNTPIEWIVLDYDTKYNGYILISKDILFKRRFNTSDIGSWQQDNNMHELRDYLNSTFYNSSFVNTQKNYICKVNSIGNQYDNVFLLGDSDGGNYKYSYYLSFSSSSERKAKYNNEYSDWWLISGSSQRIHYINTSGNSGTSGASYVKGVRPMIVVDIHAFQNNHSLINPLYCERVWGLRHTGREISPNGSYSNLIPLREDSMNKDFFTVSEQISVHNPNLQGKADISELFDKIKRDFAIYGKYDLLEDTVYSYNKVFDNYKVFEESSLQDGLYLTFTTVFLVENSKVYASGNLPYDSQNNNLNTIENVFFSKMQEVDDSKLPEVAIYVSCWADLDPNLSFYMPYREKDKSIFWLGERFINETIKDSYFPYKQNGRYIVHDTIYDRLSALLCTKFTLYI